MRLPVLGGDPGPAEALGLVLLAGLPLDLELVRGENAVLVGAGARPNRSLRASFPEGLLVVALLLHAAQSVRGKEILLLYLLLGELLSAGLEALATARALALRLRWPVRNTLALVSLGLDLGTVGHVLEVLQVGVVVVHYLSLTLLGCALFAGRASADAGQS